MASYNEIDGIPSHSNQHLLRDVLREEWGFQGVLVSDYFGIPQLETLQHSVANRDQAATVALESGVDMELPAAGETKTVEFPLGFAELSFLNRDMHRVVEAGTFKIMVGGNSRDLTETELHVVAAGSSLWP